MWNVYLSSTEVAAFSADGACHWIATSEVGHGINAGLDLVASSCRRWPKPRVSFWLSGELARPFVLSPLTGLRTWAEAQAYAQASYTNATGITAPAQLFMDGWPAESAALAVAVESSVVSAISAAADSRRIRLRSISPWWAIALARSVVAGEGAGIFVADEQGALTVLTGSGGRWSSAQTLTPKPDAELRHALYGRLAAAHGVDALELSVTCWRTGESSGDWPCVSLDDGGARG